MHPICYHYYSVTLNYDITFLLFEKSFALDYITYIYIYNHNSLAWSTIYQKVLNVKRLFRSNLLHSAIFHLVNCFHQSMHIGFGVTMINFVSDTCCHFCVNWFTVKAQPIVMLNHHQVINSPFMCMG